VGSAITAVSPREMAQYEGELAWPERFDEAWHRNIALLGDNTCAGQDQQSPVPAKAASASAPRRLLAGQASDAEEVGLPLWSGRPPDWLPVWWRRPQSARQAEIARAEAQANALSCFVAHSCNQR
jgi:hypothetical protein